MIQGMREMRGVSPGAWQMSEAASLWVCNEPSDNKEG